jgi:hypothetical protein
VALLTIPPVSGVKDFIVGVRSVPKPINGQVVFQFLSSVDLVDHGLHVNRFCGQLVSRTTCFVVPDGVMAHDAELHVLATAAVQRKRAVAAVAILLSHHTTPGNRSRIGSVRERKALSS